MLVSVTIISNENMLNVPIYHKESTEKSHEELAIEFCNLVGLGYDTKNVYKSLIEIGCIVILTMGDDTVLTWLPKTVSKKQYQKTYELKPFFENYTYQEFTAWYNNDFHIYPKKELPKDKVLDMFYEKFKEYYEPRNIRTRIIKDDKKE